MAILPGVKVVKVNGNLTPPAAAPNKPLFIGPASAGTKNKVVTFANPGDINGAIGFGPVAVLAQIYLSHNGGNCDLIVASGSIAATTSTVLSSSAAPAMTVTGAANDTFDAKVIISSAGDLTSARFQYTLDGGQNFSAALPITGTFPVPNTGLTLTFPAASYLLAQEWDFKTVGPTMNSSDFTNAANVFTGSNTTPTYVAVANDTPSAAAGATLGSAMDATLSTFGNEDNSIFTAGLVPAGGTDGDTAGTNAAWASVAASAGNVLGVAAERARCILPVPFAGYGNPRLPFAYAVADRAGNNDPSMNPARKATGALTGWSDPTYDEAKQGAVYLPNNTMAPRSFKNDPGVFINQGTLKSAQGSPYLFWQWGRVINLIAITTWQALTPWINKAVRVGKGGVLDTRDANLLDGQVNSALSAAVDTPTNTEGFNGYATSTLYATDRNFNVLSTSTVQGTVDYVPLANVSTIQIQVGFAVPNS